MLKKICLCVALFMSLVYAAAALDTGTREAAPVPASLADIDAEGLKLAALIGQRLSALAGSAPQPPRIRIDEFPDNGSRSILGRLWAQNLMGGLANLANRGFTLTLDPAPSSCDFILSGEIIEAGPTIRIITRLVKTKEHELAAIWNTDFQKTPFMRELLGPAAEMVPSESRRAAQIFQPDRYETDSRETPAPFQAGGDWVSRTFHSATDEDWFIITVNSPGILVLETGGSLDTLMKLYAPGSSSALEEDDDDGEDTNARIEYYAGSGGESYIVNIRSYDEEPGEYQFRAFLQEAPRNSIDTKSNNTREQALELDFAVGFIHTAFDSSSDNDWYCLNIPDGGGRLRVSTEGGRDTFMVLYDAGGEEIKKNDDSGSGYNASITIEVPAGPVYLCISEYEHATGIYALRFSLEH